MYNGNFRHVAHKQNCSIHNSTFKDILPTARHSRMTQQMRCEITSDWGGNSANILSWRPCDLSVRFVASASSGAVGLSSDSISGSDWEFFRSGTLSVQLKHVSASDISPLLFEYVKPCQSLTQLTTLTSEIKQNTTQILFICITFVFH